jgi:hypothetical protein
LRSKILPHLLLGRSQAEPSVWPLHGYLQQVGLAEKRGNTVTNLLCLQLLLVGKKLEIERYFFRHKSAQAIPMFSKTKDLCVWNFSRKILFVSGKYLLRKKHGRRLLFYKATPPPLYFFVSPLAQGKNLSDMVNSNRCFFHLQF